MRRLSLLRAQELPSRGQIEKELSDLDHGARRGAGRLDLDNLPAADHHLRALGRIAVPLPRREREPAHARNARQRLPAKPHRRNRRQVLRLPDLARRVALQTQQRVVAAHPHTVVRHPHQAAPARLDFHHDPRRLRVERVLNQLLHRAGGAFHHLARGDLIGDLLGK